MEYSMAVTVILPWVAMVGTTEVDTDGTAARAMATTVALAVEAPCTIESRGPWRGNPRICTVARGKTHGRPRKCHGHCRGPPPKSQIMCIRAQLSVPKRILWTIAPSGTMYALTASCAVATQKALKHCTFNRIILPVFRGVPLNSNHLRSRTCCTADGDAAPDASILSKNEHDTNNCGIN